MQNILSAYNGIKLKMSNRKIPEKSEIKNSIMHLNNP